MLSDIRMHRVVFSTIALALVLGFFLAGALPAGAVDGFNVRQIRIDTGGGSTDSDFNSTTEAISVEAAATGTGPLVVGPTTYNVGLFINVTNTIIDYNSGGDFSVNNAYPGGSTDDMLIRAHAHVTIPAGTWSIAAASDDGRIIQVDGVTLSAIGGQTDLGGVGTDNVGYDGTSGHEQSIGVFTVTKETRTELYSLFFERNGGDSFEVSLAQGSNTTFDTVNFSLLTNGLHGWGVETERPVRWSDLGVTNVTTNGAVAYATLDVAGGSNAVASLFWDLMDHGETNSAWAFTNSLGTVATGLVQNALMTDLAMDTTHYYRFYGTNSATGNHGWSDAMSFRTLTLGEWDGSASELWGTAANWSDNNVPDTPGEPARFRGVGTGDVDLGGSSYTSAFISLSSGDYDIIDTNAFPGTLTAGALTNSGGANTIDVKMDITGTAEVSGGTLTLKDTTNFSANLIELSGGTLGVAGSIGLDYNKLTERYFSNSYGDDRLDPIDSGNGYLVQSHDYEGILDVALDFNANRPNSLYGSGTANLGGLWFGNIIIGAVASGDPLEAGDVTFGTRSDDGSVVWVDLDQDGDFETGEMLVSNKGSHAAQNRVGDANLSEGVYGIAIAWWQGGGGHEIEARYAQGIISEANYGTMTVIDPTSGAQAGLWSIGGAGPIVMTNIPARVLADSEINANASTAAMGSLTVTNNANLNISGDTDSVTFNDVTIAADATEVGFNAGVDTYLTEIAGLEGSSAEATITKSGSGSLILNKAASNVPAGAKFDVVAGSLVAVHSNAFGAASLELSGGTLALSSPGGDQTYDGPLPVDADSTLTAGQYGGGVTGPVTVAFGSAGNSIAVSSGTLSVGTTDSYTLELRGNPSGALNITDGDVRLTAAATNLGSVTLSGGTLTVTNHLEVIDLISAGGTFIQLGTNNDLTVVSNLTITADLDMGSANLNVSNATVTVNSGATLTDNVPLTADTLAVDNGGAFNVPGVLTASTKFSFDPVSTISNILAGSAYVVIGENKTSDGLVTLTGTNTYTGKTMIERGVLRADESIGFPTNSLLEFSLDNSGQYGILETSGTFDRTIGNAAGQVRWENHGGFAALGGPLTIDLTRNDGAPSPLAWNDVDNGFGGKVLTFGSTTADSLVHLTNSIDMNQDAEIRVHDNTSETGDVFKISGIITESGGSRTFRKRGAGVLWLTGSNTWNGITYINDNGTLRAVDGMGLSTNDSYLRFENGILESSGTFTRNIGAQNDSGNVYWENGGGFAAYGGTLDVILEGGADLSWDGNGDTGFRDQELRLSSRTATHTVDMKNNISLDANRTVRVYDNPETDQDIGKISGNFLQNGDRILYVAGGGTLWLTGTNIWTAETDIREGSVLRAVDGIGLPREAFMRFRNGTFETSGMFTNHIGQGDGQVDWENQGGFSAWGGPLTVLLEDGIDIAWGDNLTGFSGQELYLGSDTANDVVDLQNDITLGGNRTVRVFDNPHSTGDYAVMSGVISGGNQLYKRGSGLLVLSGASTYTSQTRVYEGELRVNGSLASDVTYVSFDPGNTGRLSGTGAVDQVDVRDGGTLAPGESAGALKTTDRVYMRNNSIYEWELGASAYDTVEVTGDLDLDSNWTLKLLSAGGTPAPYKEYDLFTYTGILTTEISGSNLTSYVLDASEIPDDWMTNNLEVIRDGSGTPNRVYLTGLYSVLSMANLPATNLTSTSAVLNGAISCEGTTLQARVYWSTSDWGTVGSDWEANGSSAHVGEFTNEIGKILSYSVGSLDTNTQYYFAFRATNTAATIDLWGMPTLSFTILGRPVVTNSGVSDIAAGGTATLAGSFTDHNRGTVTICWGLTDGGTDSTGDWQYSTNIGAQAGSTFLADISGLLYPLGYVYRCYATNDYGEGWSDPVTAFMMDEKPLPPGLLPVTDGLIAEYKFEDNADDTGPNGDHASLEGDTHYIDGRVGRAASMDGNGDYIDIPNLNGDIASDGITYAMWINLNENGADTDVIMNHDGWESGKIHFSMAGTDTIRCDFNGGGGNKTATQQIFNDGNWYYVVYSANGTLDDVDYFMDSDLDGTLTSAGHFDNSATRTVLNDVGRQIGGWGNARWLKADIDEVTIFNRGLTMAEAQQIYDFYTAPLRSGISVTNIVPSEVGTNSATLRASLSCEGAVYHAWVFWGSSNGGTNGTGWDVGPTYVGVVSNATAIMSHYVTHGAGTWWYTFMASNELDQIWADPSKMYLTATTPTVDNDDGAVSITTNSAILRGELTAGGAAKAYVYWGLTDGANDPSAWGNTNILYVEEGTVFGTTADGLTQGDTYYYRCFASNVTGTAWAPNSQVFIPGVVFVDTNATTGADNGTSWLNAYIELTDALSDAPAGFQLWVAEGRYSPGTTNSDSFYLTDQVVYGGFTNGAVWVDRDPVNNATVLDGGGTTYHVVEKSGIATPTLDGFTIANGLADGSNPEDKGAGLYVFDGDLIVNNCKFMNNIANDDGGAVYLLNGVGSPVFSNCTFTGNQTASGNDHRGGAIYFDDGDVLTISGCHFDNNTAGDEGGAISSWGESGGMRMDVSDSQFYDNVSQRGAGVFLRTWENGVHVFSNCVFNGNSATNAGDRRGGAVYTEESWGIEFYSCSFTNNQADQHGGAVFVHGRTGAAGDYKFIGCGFTNNNAATEDGGAIRFGNNFNTEPITISNCSFVANGCGDGGGDNGGAIFADDVHKVTVVDCLFSNNTAAGEAGAVRFWQSDITFDNCTFVTNVADSEGGAVRLHVRTGGTGEFFNCVFTDNRSDNQDGGGIRLSGNSSMGPLVVSNCTFNANRAGDASDDRGGAIYVEDGGIMTVVDCLFTNNTAGDEGGAICSSGDQYSMAVHVRDSQFYGGTAQRGGAMFVRAWDNGTHIVSNCVFEGQAVTQQGGAVFMEEADVEIYDCTFTNNQAIGNGGAVSLHVRSGMTATFVNCAFTTNLTSTAGGGAAYVSGGTDATFKYINCGFTNCISDTDDGGAIRFGNNASMGAVLITNCSFVSCRAGDANDDRGGAIYAEDGDVMTVVGCRFSGNDAGDEGGGICSYGDQYSMTLNVRNSRFYECTADRGGGVFVRSWDNGTQIFSNCFFRGNSTRSTGDRRGGAVFTEESDGITFYDCSFTNNIAYSQAGAVYLHGRAANVAPSGIEFFNCGFTNNIALKDDGGAIRVANRSDMEPIVISNCTFTANSCGNDEKDYGGAMYSDEVSSVTIIDSVFSNNTATGEGGAVRLWNGEFEFNDCAFVNNHAVYHGGAIRLRVRDGATADFLNCEFTDNSSANEDGGAIRFDNNPSMGPTVISNCTFSGNHCGNESADYGGAIYGDDVSSVSVIDSVFSNNTATGEGGAVRLWTGEFEFNGCTFVTNYAAYHGGAIRLRVRDGATADFLNCEFTDNRADYEDGGAIRFENNPNMGPTVISNCTFNGNHCGNENADHGGAICGDDSSAVTVIGSVFTGNTASGEGGAVRLWTGEFEFNDCTFVNNQATFHGGALRLRVRDGATAGFANCDFTGNSSANEDGGAIRFENNLNMGPTTISNCTFSGNHCGNDEEDSGGAIYAQQGGTMTVQDSTFSDNESSAYGGAICIEGNANGMRLDMTRVNFLGNTSDGQGGALYSSGYKDGENIAMLNCLFAGNEAIGNQGGSLWLNFDTTTDIDIENCTFHANAASTGGGAIQLQTGILNVDNSIFYANDGGSPADTIYGNGGDTANLAYSNIDTNKIANIGTVNVGTGILNTDPLFVDPIDNDCRLKSLYGHWEVSSGSWSNDLVMSPCIDAGDPGSDYSNETRYENGKRINMGAYGNTEQASKSLESGRSTILLVR